jgi:DNA-binding NarL/FixJ family response regulator
MTSLAGDRGVAPITVALVNDHQIVVEALRDMLAPYVARIEVVDIEVGTDNVAPADVALFDTLGGQRHALSRARALIERHQVGQLIVYARDPSPAFVRAADEEGVSEVIDRRSSAKTSWTRSRPSSRACPWPAHAPEADAIGTGRTDAA